MFHFVGNHLNTLTSKISKISSFISILTTVADSQSLPTPFVDKCFFDSCSFLVIQHNHHRYLSTSSQVHHILAFHSLLHHSQVLHTLVHHSLVLQSLGRTVS